MTCSQARLGGLLRAVFIVFRKQRAFSSPRKMYRRSTYSAKRVPVDLGRVRLSAEPSIKRLA
jgi:hypothetical protein